VKGGKTKVGVSHVPQFSPSYTHIPKWSSIIINTHKIPRDYGLWVRVWVLGFMILREEGEGERERERGKEEVKGGRERERGKEEAKGR